MLNSDSESSTLLIELNDTDFIARVLRSAVRLYETVMDAVEDDDSVDNEIVRSAHDFQAVIEEGAYSE